MQQQAELDDRYDMQQLRSPQELRMTDRLWAAGGLSLAWRGWACARSSLPSKQLEAQGVQHLGHAKADTP